MTETAPDITASLDQMGATLRSVSNVVGEYHCGLVAAGLPVEAAGKIAADYAHQMHVLMCPPPNPLAGLLPGAGS